MKFSVLSAILLLASVAVVHAQQPAADAVAGVAFIDANGNGTQDDDEPAVAGIEIRLLNADGVVVGTVTSGADGSYTFSGIDSGTFRIQFTDAGGKTYTGASFTKATGQGVTAAFPLTTKMVLPKTASLFNPTTKTTTNLANTNANAANTTGEEVSRFTPENETN